MMDEPFFWVLGCVAVSGLGLSESLSDWLVILFFFGCHCRHIFCGEVLLVVGWGWDWFGDYWRFESALSTGERYIASLPMPRLCFSPSLSVGKTGMEVVVALLVTCVDLTFYLPSIWGLIVYKPVNTWLYSLAISLRIYCYILPHVLLYYFISVYSHLTHVWHAVPTQLLLFISEQYAASMQPCVVTCGSLTQLMHSHFGRVYKL